MHVARRHQRQAGCAAQLVQFFEPRTVVGPAQKFGGDPGAVGKAFADADCILKLACLLPTTDDLSLTRTLSQREREKLWRSRALIDGEESVVLPSPPGREIEGEGSSAFALLRRICQKRGWG